MLAPPPAPPAPPVLLNRGGSSAEGAGTGPGCGAARSSAREVGDAGGGEGGHELPGPPLLAGTSAGLGTSVPSWRSDAPGPQAMSRCWVSGCGPPPPGPPGAENGFLLLMSSCRKSVGSGVQGSGFRVQGCRVQGSGFRVQGSGCMVQHKRGDRVPGMAARAEGVPERRLMRSVFESGDFVKFQTHAEASWMLQTFTENPGGWTYDPGNTCYVFGAPNYLNNIIK